uniref:Uncharacterized protein n=1 Tax=Caenorhabditis japonica TaxID=281687 RepID=A0A8R1ETX4_CAEJA
TVALKSSNNVMEKFALLQVMMNSRFSKICPGTHDKFLNHSACRPGVVGHQKDVVGEPQASCRDDRDRSCRRAVSFEISSWQIIYLFYYDCEVREKKMKIK